VSKANGPKAAGGQKKTMQKLLFATGNAHKLEEVSAILEGIIELKSFKDISFAEEVPEPGETLVDNAYYKTNYLYKRFGGWIVADDTGLEVEALHGAPGVYSARYAGIPSNSENNMQKLLKALEGVDNRKAQFRTVLVLIKNDKLYSFDGIVKGQILTEKRGTGGFGYDPLFLPDGYDKTFGELPAETKNKISHRARAFELMARHFTNL